MGCSTNTIVSQSSIKSHFLKISLRRRQAKTVRDGTSSHKIHSVTKFKMILNFKEHQNRMIGLKVTASLLNRWILPNGGVVSDSVSTIQRLQTIADMMMIMIMMMMNSMVMVTMMMLMK